MIRLQFLIFFISISTPVLSHTLHLYGGSGHDVYLGCLNCSNYVKNSIWNEYGSYGSSYQSNSIWNQYGTYGSAYNTYSPWNEYSSNSPIVVDKEGNFYGYFSKNKYRDKRADFELALIIYKYHDEIKDDVSGWYSEIFD